MHHYLLSLLILLPLLGAVAVLFVRHTSPYPKYIAAAVSLLQVVLCIVAAQHYVATGGLQLLERVTWFAIDMGSWGMLQADYFLAVDGLSFPLVGLTVFIMLIAVISSWTIEHKTKGYFSLLLVLNAAIVGTFCAQDFLLFYLFFEFMLLPMFFLIGIWGGPRREYASIKFFLYTLLGSILILIVLIALYLSTQRTGTSGMVHTFSLVDMQNGSNIIQHSLLHPDNTVTIGGLSIRTWAFIFLLIGFGIKLPMVPLHTWLPDAHVEAPTPISVLLAALLLKIGGYGLLRIIYPIFPDVALEFSWLVALLGVISIIYGGLAAMASKDLKRLIAYSSVSHMGFILLGVASGTPEGTAGAVYQMVSHGIISALLFILVGVLYDRTHDRAINHYSGLAAKMPVYFSFTLVGFFASLGLPGFSGFMAELLVFLGAFKSGSSNGLLHESLALVGMLGLVISAAYYLWTLQRMFFGPFHVKGFTATLADLTLREKAMLLPLAIATLLLGIFPQVLLTIVNPFAEAASTSLMEAGNFLKNLTL
jgi:NADH-quinone oxidoreductase subunit M